LDFAPSSGSLCELSHALLQASLASPRASFQVPSSSRQQSGTANNEPYVIISKNFQDNKISIQIQGIKELSEQNQAPIQVMHIS
jgi:hypothetical protein